MEENLKKVVSHKLFLLTIKYIPYFISLGYFIYTILSFFEVDIIILGYFIHMSMFSWLFMYLTSFIFKFCWKHRLPLYYILINETLTVSDYYIHIPIVVNGLLILHLSIFILFITIYTIKTLWDSV